MILDDILASKRRELDAARTTLPLEELQRRVPTRRVTRGFREALTSGDHRPALVAELKRKSPSRGMLRERFDPVRLAQELEAAGAAALSVLTDESYFGGHLEFLRDAHQFTEIPTLRKDFIIDPYQVYEAAHAQADALLLIVAALTEPRLAELIRLTEHVGLDALVEVHSDAELQTALRAGAQTIGINHRDLRTFTMDMTLSARLVPQIPRGRVIVAESGIHTPDDVRRLRDLGVHALLIGESLMVAPDPATKVRELFTDAWSSDEQPAH